MPETEIFSDSFPAFGGNCDLVFTGLNSDDAKLILQKVKNEIEQLENIISPASMISDINKLNNSGSDIWVDVDPVLMNILSISSDFFEMSNGAFDICCGALYSLWKQNQNPDSEQIKDAKQNSGFNFLEIDIENNKVRFLKKRLQLDLRAIDKAYAADSLKNLLIENNVNNCIVSFDEEVVLALGRHPSGQAWPIGIRNIQQPGKFIHVFDSSNQFTVNTGTIKLDLETANIVENIIVSPETGLKVEGKRTVSVTGNSAVLSAFLAHIWLILPEHDQSIVVEQLTDLEVFEAEYLADDIKTKLTLLKEENYE
ncbi:MAG TPA: FAD:protein FMN transferase [Draconibacterium sp.]|nr:FAD:protein FMN transferase [Draconibacterium sp.]